VRKNRAKRESGTALASECITRHPGDPARFGALDHFENETAAFLEYVRSAKKAEGVADILIPGDPERINRGQRAQAFALDAGTLAQLDAAAHSINQLRGTRLPRASSIARR
jgi:LDH2 family malate/lactate/ureidoglycolate dehydrogenase